MGVFEQAKGKIKEAAGELSNNRDLEREGTAQKKKGEAERLASQSRAEAKVHEAKAKEKEFEQKAAQERK